MLSGIVGGVFLTIVTASAAELATKSPKALPFAVQMPAVDGINGKIDGFGGTFANKSIGGAKGSLSIPLAAQYGLQIDGAAGKFDSKSFGVIAGHLFWRNPAQGMVGLYANHTYWNQFGGVKVSQVGGEAEYYLGQLTLQGVGGVEFGNTATSITGTPLAGFVVQSIDIRTRFFDQINVAYYLQDNWKAFVGHRYLGGKNALALGTEWAMPVGTGKMASLFVEGRVGESNFRGVWGGIRVYFGQKDKPLIQRHRQDDPIEWSPESLFTIAGSSSTTTVPGVTPPSCDESCDESCDGGQTPLNQACD
jgi:hypothetical protein